MYHLNADMMVFFELALEAQFGNLILPNLNSLKYNLAYPNPNPLSVAVLDVYHATRSPATSPDPSYSPAATPAPNQTRNIRSEGLRNKCADVNLLLPTGCNLRTLCAS